jgi:hypothetical protein
LTDPFLRFSSLDTLHQTSERQARESPNLGVPATADRQVLTVDEGLFRIGKERNCGGDSLDLAVTFFEAALAFTGKS